MFSLQKVLCSQQNYRSTLQGLSLSDVLFLIQFCFVWVNKHFNLFNILNQRIDKETLFIN